MVAAYVLTDRAIERIIAGVFAPVGLAKNLEGVALADHRFDLSDEVCAGLAREHASIKERARGAGDRVDLEAGFQPRRRDGVREDRAKRAREGIVGENLVEHEVPSPG